MTEAIDHQARSKIGVVETELHSHIDLCVTAAKKNDQDHAAMKQDLKEMGKEARMRWAWLILLIISGMGAIIVMLVEVIKKQISG